MLIILLSLDRHVVIIKNCSLLLSSRVVVLRGREDATRAHSLHHQQRMLLLGTLYNFDDLILKLLNLELLQEDLLIVLFDLPLKFHYLGLVFVAPS